MNGCLRRPGCDTETDFMSHIPHKALTPFLSYEIAERETGSVVLTFVLYSSLDSPPSHTYTPLSCRHTREVTYSKNFRCLLSKERINCVKFMVTGTFI